MKERILELLRHTGLTATRLADEIGVQRSGISHIISGRNQPSYDFMVRILERFPEISADWLLTGKGNMIRGINNLPENKTKIKPVDNPALPEEINNNKQVTNVTFIEKVILLHPDGTFEVYRNSENQ